MTAELDAIREAYVLSVAEFESCKTYCLANSAVCAWNVLWLLRDQMEDAKNKFLAATKKALRKRQLRPTFEELENNEVFMEAFFNEASKNTALETKFFFCPEAALEDYYDNLIKKNE